MEEVDFLLMQEGGLRRQQEKGGNFVSRYSEARIQHDILLGE